MKKFLALLFVCAGLTAMAAPNVNKAGLPQVNKGQMVMKANNFGSQLTANVNKSFMAAAKKNVQKTDLTNQMNNRAPKRLSAEEIIEMPYVAFLYKANYDDDGNYVEADPFYAGAGAFWYPDTSEGLYLAGLAWDSEGGGWYLPIDIDFSTGEVAIPWGILIDNDSTSSGAGRNRTDTLTFVALLSEDYYLNGNQNDCMGNLYTDGSIIFEDNYVYYEEVTINKYNNGTLVSSNTNTVADVYIGTEILAANGELNYTLERTGAADNSPVYMFQNEAADTLFVGNMWNFGMPNIVLNVSSDCKVRYNCIAETGDDGTIYLDNPIWDIDDTWISGGLGMMYGIGGYTLDDDGYIDEFIWGFDADATSEQITWDYTGPTNGYHLYYGYLNNVLTWTNGDSFRFPAPDFVRGDVNRDNAVNISDVTTLIDHLLSGDLDDSDDFSGDAADTNLDGGINISDVTALIDYLLGGTWPAE